jgi:uncharacterized protein (DUF1800 family)
MMAGGCRSSSVRDGVSGGSWRTAGVLCLGWAGFMAGCSGGGGTTQPAVKPAVTISGAAQARLGSTVQLSATVMNTSNTAVTWQVNGVAGGSSVTGTISATGLYTPPATIPSPNTLTITAVTQATPVATASLMESILNPLPVVTTGSVTPGLSPTSFNLDLIGTGFLPSSQVQVAGGTVPATFVSSTELRASITLVATATTAAVAVTNPDPGGSASASTQLNVAKTSLTAAARLLDQTTFGSTLSDIEHVQQVGLNSYLAEQFAMPPTLLPKIPTPPPAVCMNTTLPCEQSEWWQAVLTGNDQLRQRVALALSEIFVISTNSVQARAVTPYQNMLATDAFTNYSTIMKDVTLSTGMGAYLNMLDSNKPGIVNGVPQIANENYARELMQLFSTGLVLLNPDGTPQLDAVGNQQPEYTEAQVQAFARAYTGWTFATATGGVPTKFPNGTANYDVPMVAVESAHDMTAKVLLSGTTLPSGQSAEQDLAGALANIFSHPNVGPFVCRQLIQHLVASNPNPAYVGRVAAVFADNGQGVRGDMKAVITAILMDADARAGDTNPNFEGGHLREPMLYMTNVMRGLGFINKDAAAGNDVVANASYNTVGNYTSSLGERPYSSGSVFNFFPPNYVIPGTTLNAPEFGQENTASAVLRLSLANSVVYNGISGFTVDLSKTSPLGITASATGNAMTDSGNLVDSLAVIFMHGQMPAQMRTDIVNHIATLTDPAQRVRVATYLVITSSFYKIEN